MTTCKGCIHKSVCEKARYIENYKILGCCDQYKDEKSFVEVVRCQDCKWYYKKDCFCNNFAIFVWDDYFCSKGVRGKKK